MSATAMKKRSAAGTQKTKNSWLSTSIDGCALSGLHSLRSLIDGCALSGLHSLRSLIDGCALSGLHSLRSSFAVRMNAVSMSTPEAANATYQADDAVCMAKAVATAI